MDVGFTVIGRDDGVTFRLFATQQSGRPPLVTTSWTSEYCVVLMGRLYYRRELAAELSRPISHGLTTDDCSDAALAAAAYSRWGGDGLARLEGDFALVLWDVRARRLVGARDPLGGYPLYWANQRGQVAFSTSLRSLLHLRPDRTLDHEYLAEYLMLPGCFQSEVWTERCVYQGVQRVLPTTLVSVQFPGGTVQRSTCWDWLNRLVDPGTDRLEEISACYADQLRQAVRQRLCGRTVAHLSGGMDSTAVALLANEAIRAGVGEGPLHTVSLVYERLPILAGEKRYIEEVLGRHRDLVAHFLPADDLAGYAAPPFHEEPWPAALWVDAERLESELIARTGATTLLTGFGAEETLGGEPNHLADLLRRGRLLAAWREAARWAKAGHCNRWRVLYPHGLAHLLPAWARDGLGPLLHGGYARWYDQTPYTIGSWIRPDFARRYQLRGRALGHLRRLTSRCDSVRLSIALAGIAERSGDLSRWHVAAPHGFLRAHPFLDTRLVRLGLGIQARVQPVPGRHKPILAQALSDVLPEVVRDRRQTGDFNEYYFEALARSVPRLEAVIHWAAVDDLGLFDKKVLLHSLQQAALGIARDMRTLDRLHLTLSFLQWLHHQDEWQRVEVPASEVIRVPGLTRPVSPPGLGSPSPPFQRVQV
jgi:asparagine synthase (glutamine-hydrolysing)